MGGFHFRLQAVRELRQHAEKEQQDALLRERRRLDALTAESVRLGDDFTRWSGQYLESGSRGLPVREIARIRTYLDELCTQISRNAAMIREQEAAVEQERLRLVEWVKERRVLDTLHDQKYTEFTQQQRRKSYKELEDQMAGRV